MDQWKTKEQLLNLLCKLVGVPSITGSRAEASLPFFIAGQLATLAYFRRNPQHLQTVPTGDGRHFVTALAKKNTGEKRTILLVSHFDVVGVEEYGCWKELAFDAERLTREFYFRREQLPPQAGDDVETGHWLFGRGTMDMKCGLALHMAMLEQACRGEFEGNVLLLSVPDEEAASAGMKAAVPVLIEMAKRYGLEYIAAVNSEPSFPRFPGDAGKYIYTGSVGKILPGFFCYGKETHVSEPFAGLNANFMTSLLQAEMELNAEFCETVEAEVFPPPANLLQKDLKKEYSVQLPHRAVSIYNLFLLERTIDGVLALLQRAAGKAAQRMQAGYAGRVEQMAKLGPFPPPPDWKVNVFTYAALASYAEKTYGTDALVRLGRRVLNQRPEQDDRERTIALVDELCILCKEQSPMVVIFFAPPYYPAVSSRHNPLIRQVAAEMQEYAQANCGVTLQKQNYFRGISDLSYLGPSCQAGSLQALAANMPLAHTGHSLPLEQPEALHVPVLNLGPAGKDAHQWTERLDLDFAFGALPALLNVCIHKLFTVNVLK